MGKSSQNGGGFPSAAGFGGGKGYESSGTSNVSHGIKCSQCNKPAVLRTVIKQNENHGRKFYGCGERGCQFFLWEDEATPSGISQGGGFGGSSRKDGGFSRDRADSDSSESVMPRCDCGFIAQELTCKTGLNEGRKFYKCTKQKKCGFFKWANEIGVSNENNYSENRSYSVNRSGGGVSSSYDMSSVECYKCHQVILVLELPVLILFPFLEGPLCKFLYQ